MRLTPIAGLLLALLLAAPALATPPGQNGLLLVSRGNTLLTVSADDSGLRRVTRGFDGAFSPDGQRVVFSRAVGRTEARLFTAAADGSDERPLLRVRGRAVAQPSWSPDGTRIAFAGTVDNRTGELYTIAADGSDRRRLTRSNVSEINPTWTPDGTTIVYGVNRRASRTLRTGAIRSIPAAGGTPRQLTPFLGRDELEPSVAPDGSRIVFGNPTIGFTSSDLATIPVAGGAQSTIRNARLFETAVVWSPDGARLAFTADSSRAGGRAVIDVYTANVDGSDVRRITRGAGDYAIVDWQRLP